MTRKQALAELIAKVEAGKLDAFWCGATAAAWPDEMPYNGDTITLTTALDAYNGSLDAALALHEAVLPEWEWSVGRDFAEVWVEQDFIEPFQAVSTSPARAWLLAILKALHAQETEE